MHQGLNASGELNIVGAGIKGLEAAVYASSMGMKVTIHERRNRIGGQLLDITDSEKKKEFQSLLNYYSIMIRKLGIWLDLGSEYSGQGLYCLPEKTYEHLPEKDGIIIDSNIYQHHDEILALSGKYRLKVTERSLDSMDRVRRNSYEKKLRENGVEIIKGNSEEFSVSINERFQYDIRSAMVSGRNAVVSYLRKNRKNIH
jgi:monoamine oxidase